MASRFGTGKGAFRRILGQNAGESSGDPNATVDSRSDRLLPRSYSPRNASFQTAAQIRSLDRSPDQTHAIIAGPKVFKTIRVTESEVTEETDLRASITAHASANNEASSAAPDQLDIKSVKWGHASLATIVVTASANGRITLYDVNQGREAGRIHEHARQVHELAISPFQERLLLSASQDGTVKMFDLKASEQGRNGLVFRCKASCKCNAGAVRDVKWSPTEGYIFACTTDQGVVQKWDLRKPNVPLLKLNAHESACLTISWHPDGQHLLTGGVDQYLKVWDVSPTADRRQKPKYVVNTPAPVFFVAWRPPCWSATGQGRRAAQVAVTYDDRDPTGNQNSSVHIWDLARPGLPFKEITHWDYSRTGLFWHNRDLLWTVGKDGEFNQNDVVLAPRVLDRRGLSTVALSPWGDLTALLEKRHTLRRARPTASTPTAEIMHTGNGGQGKSSSFGDIPFNISRSDSEEEVVGSFLKPRNQSRRRNSVRTTTTSSAAHEQSESKVMNLDDAVKVTGVYESRQVMAMGHAPTTAKRKIYMHFANRYLLPLARDLVNPQIPESLSMDARIDTILVLYANAAQEVRYYRLAQSWRVLAYTMNLLLVRRAKYRRDKRLKQWKDREEKRLKLQRKQDGSPMNAGQHILGDVTPRAVSEAKFPIDSAIHRSSRSILSEEIESTSGMTTPLARPVKERGQLSPRSSALNPSMAEPEAFELPPPSIHSPGQNFPRQPNSPSTKDVRTPHVEGYDFYGVESLTSHAIDIAAPQKKTPLRLDMGGLPEAPPSRPAPPVRHDSSESFEHEMFSTSNESQTANYNSSFDGSDTHKASSSGGRKSEILSSAQAELSWSDSTTQSSSAGNDQDARFSSFSSDDRADIVDVDGVLAIHGQTNPPPTLRVQEASFSTNNDYDLSTTQISNSGQLDYGDSDPEEPPSSDILPDDYLPRPCDPTFMPDPLDPSSLVQQFLSYETLTGVVSAAALVLCLLPLLPAKTINEEQARAILRQYHLRLEGMMLFQEATLLRNLCHPFLSIYPPRKYDQDIHFFCQECGKRLDDETFTTGKWRCKRCRSLQAGCAVCLGYDVPDSERYFDDDQLKYIDPSAPAARLWLWCQGCGHGGHQACMRAWHSGPEYDEGRGDSGGMCPLEGCLHDCIPGEWRDRLKEEKDEQKEKEINRLIKENTKGKGVRTGVKRDSREIKESRAVGSVRESLGAGAAANLERKRSVKVLAPGEA